MEATLLLSSIQLEKHLEKPLTPINMYPFLGHAFLQIPVK